MTTKNEYTTILKEEKMEEDCCVDSDEQPDTARQRPPIEFQIGVKVKIVKIELLSPKVIKTTACKQST